MYIAYIRDSTPIKKPSRRDKIQALADHLIAKWTAVDEEKAQKWWDGLSEESKEKLLTQ